MFAYLRQLARTSAMRLALRAALLQVGILMVALALLFVLLNRYVDRQIESALAGELAALASLPGAHRVNSVRVLAASGSHKDLRYYRLEAADGRTLAGNVAQWPAALAADSRVRMLELRVREPGEDHDEWVSLPAVAARLPGGGRLLVAQAPGALEELRETVLGIAAALLGVSALLALALGVSLGRQWLARIEAIDRTAGKIAAGDLSQRVETSGRKDEFDLLAAHLNAMLARIEAAVAGMRDVSDNVAHDLRKPLARLQTRIEVVLAQPRAADDYRTALAQTAADVGELMRTFDALLSIARLEAGSDIASPERFDLAEQVRQVTELYAAEAEDEGRPFSVELTAGLNISGQPALLAQALANLLDNAFKYTPPATAVGVSLQRLGDHAELAVIDHGSGIAAAERSRMTQRFARGDSARTQPGSGLGLALVEAIAHAHGGNLSLDDTPGGGLSVRLSLPLVGM
ncbi:ATP-binding protein [Thiobacillus sp.]|uniref:sensor histidine kinase n=1 Tax=Thiobacillus sp. TaxID=924 RepID=UPI00286D9F04|nr:ATP-binding protein [Thiobacillus sp.]